MTQRDYGLISRIVVFRLSFSSLLIILCLRDFLFGNGLYVYRDWTWPLSTSLFPNANFSPEIVRNSGPDPLGFVRMFFTWPVVIIERLTSSPVLAEKAYILYFFSVFILLFYLLAELTLRVLGKESNNSLVPWKREIFLVSVVLFCVTNFWFLEQLSGLYFTYIIEFALFGISTALVFLRQGLLRSMLLPGALLSLCIFLDPDLFLFGLIAVIIAILSTSVERLDPLKGFMKALERSALVLLTTLPALLTMLYVFSISSGTNLRAPGTYQSSTGNLSIINSVRLLGYLWSTVAFAPPTVISGGTGVSQLASLGAPPFLLLPAGALTGFWLLSTSFVPIFAFGSVLSSRFRRVTVPASLMGVSGLLLTQPSIFPYPYFLADRLADIPIIGGALVTVLAIPDHALILVAVSYAILTTVGIYSLITSDVMSKVPGFFRHLMPKRTSVLAKQDTARILALSLVLLLLIFQGWQLFSGSLFPSGYVWGASGNGVSDIGAFTPSNPPLEMFRVYDWLLAQRGDFNIYWPGPSGASYFWSEKSMGGIGFSDSPKPTVFPRALPYLLHSNLTSDVKDYLGALNIRYLVVQPFSRIAMQFSWGVGDSNALNMLLGRTPGIGLSFSDGDITVYQVDVTWGSVYSSSTVATHDPKDPEYAISYGVFASLGTRIALIDSSTSQELCLDNLACPLAIWSPREFGFLGPTNRIITSLDNTSVTSPSSLLQNYKSVTLPEPWNSWLATNWGPGNSTIGIDNGSMKWAFGGSPTYLTLSYNGTLTGGKPGGVAIPQDWIATTRTSFWYRTSNDFKGSIQVVIPQLNRSLSITNEIVSSPLGASSDWKFASFNTTLLTGTGYFTARIATRGTDGWVQFRNVDLDYNLLKENSDSPFGNVVPLLGESLNLNGFQGYTFVQFTGNGSLYAGGQRLNLLSPNGLSWHSLQTSLDSSMQLSGNIDVSAIVISKVPLILNPGSQSETQRELLSIVVGDPSAVVYTRPFARGFLLTSPTQSVSPSSTIDGLTIFSHVPSGTYTVSFAPITTALASYIGTLVLMFTVVVLSFLPRLRKTKLET